MKYTLECDYIGELNDKESKVFNFIILYPKYAEKRHHREAAKILHIKYETFREIFNKPKFQERYEFETMLPTMILAASKQKAALTLNRLLEAKNEHVQLNAAELILKKELNEEPNDVEDTTLQFEDWEEDKVNE